MEKNLHSYLVLIVMSSGENVTLHHAEIPTFPIMSDDVSKTTNVQLKSTARTSFDVEGRRPQSFTQHLKAGHNSKHRNTQANAMVFIWTIWIGRLFFFVESRYYLGVCG